VQLGRQSARPGAGVQWVLAAPADTLSAPCGRRAAGEFGAFGYGVASAPLLDSSMDHETRAALADLRTTMTAGFTRMDRYFELAQAQHLELRGEVQELRLRVDGLTTRLDGLTARLDGLEGEIQSLRNELRSHRDWTTREFAAVRSELKALRSDLTGLRDRADQQFGALRTDVEQLSSRMARLEQRWDDSRI
jgi:chromosome segregation ATPase